MIQQSLFSVLGLLQSIYQNDRCFSYDKNKKVK